MFILIALLNLKTIHKQNDNNIILIKSKILWRCQTCQVTRSVNDRLIKVRNVYSDQGAPRANRFTERNTLV
jgi:hypothetical protein